MFCQLTIASLIPGKLDEALKILSADASTTDKSLLGCWHTVLGANLRLFVLRRQDASLDLNKITSDALNGVGPFSVAHLAETIEVDAYATLPCAPDIPAGKFGDCYEIRTYELNPAGALSAALQGWQDVIEARSSLKPIAAVIHSLSGHVPRLVHIYPYKDMEERKRIRAAAVATSVWPPRGGGERNRVMRTEIAIPAWFSPLH